MTYYGPFPDAGPSQFSAEDFARAEFVVMDSFYRDDLFKLSYEQICRSVSGWRLYSSNYSAWIDPEGRGVMGLTACWYAAMQIGADRFGWNSYPHELAHVLQNCDPPPGTPDDYGTDARHSNWVRDGIYQAIQNAEIRLQEEFP